MLRMEWYQWYGYHTGQSCCANSSVSFHYMDPDLHYALDTVVSSSLHDALIRVLAPEYWTKNDPTRKRQVKEAIESVATKKDQELCAAYKKANPCGPVPARVDCVGVPDGGRKVLNNWLAAQEGGLLQM